MIEVQTDAPSETLALGQRLASILQPGDDPNIPDFKPLAFYRTEINKNNAPPGVMKDTPAIIAGQFGAGRVFCSSPHPEYTEGLEPFVHNAVRWAAAK